MTVQAIESGHLRDDLLPCDGCGERWDLATGTLGPADSPEHLAYMDCYSCLPDGARADATDVPRRKVVKLGPVAGRADPTQTYVLECGHTVI